MGISFSNLDYTRAGICGESRPARKGEKLRLRLNFDREKSISGSLKQNQCIFVMRKKWQKHRNFFMNKPSYFRTNGRRIF